MQSKRELISTNELNKIIAEKRMAGAVEWLKSKGVPEEEIGNVLYSKAGKHNLNEDPMGAVAQWKQRSSMGKGFLVPEALKNITEFQRCFLFYKLDCLEGDYAPLDCIMTGEAKLEDVRQLLELLKTELLKTQEYPWKKDPSRKPLSTTLTLTHTQFGPEETVLLGKFLASNPDLNCLYLDSNYINNDGIKALANGLKSNSNLKTLDLSKNKHVSDFSPLLEVLATNTSLTKLDLSKNKISDKNAKELDLSKNKISDKNAKELANLISKNSYLKEIDLEGCQISEEGLKRIYLALKTNSTLEKVTIKQDKHSLTLFGSRYTKNNEDPYKNYKGDDTFNKCKVKLT